MLQALGSFQLTWTKVKHSKPAFQFYGGYYAQFSRTYLRRIPFKVRAITCKNFLLKIYSLHGNFLNAI